MARPAERVAFFEEQARRRRESWRLIAASTLAVAIVGAPLSMLVTPLVFVVLGVATRVLALGIPAFEAAGDSLRRAALFVPGVLDTFAASDANAVLPPRVAVAAVALVIGPGVVAIVLVWIRLRAAYFQSGVAGILLAIGAREAHTGDLEERQFLNIVEEIAIAAGAAPPRVMLLDSPSRNIGIVGPDPAHATLVVARGALDSLDRDETQAAVAHLVGSAGNGDLRLALTVTSVFHSIGLVLTAFDAFAGMSRSAWRDLLLATRWLVSPRQTAAERVRELLSRSVEDVRSDGLSQWIDDAGSKSEPRTPIGRALKRFPFLWAALFPFLLLYVVVLLVRMEVFLLRSMAVGPLVMLLWRTRRYLADATAVQLTRHPDALRRALADIEQTETPVPAWARHLMIVHGAVAKDAGSAAGHLADEMGGFVSSHPPLAKRLRRIEAQGASMPEAEGTRPAPAPRSATPMHAVVAVLGGLVLVLLVPLMVAMLATAVTLAFTLAAAGSLLAAAAALMLVANLLL